MVKKEDLTYWINLKPSKKAKKKNITKSTVSPLDFHSKADSKDIVALLKEKVRNSISSKGNSLNPTRVGRGRLEPSFKFAINPHNYRRYYDFDTTLFSEQTLLKKTSKVGLEGFNFSKKNYGKEMHLENFWGCTLIIRKKTVEVINKWYGKKWKQILGNTIQEIDEQIDKTLEEMNKQSDTALKKLIQYGGGKSEFKLIKARGEIGIHGDEFLDSLPEDMIIQDTCFKKVYKKKPEFYLDKEGKPGYVKDYIANRALEKVSPEINERLDMLWEGVKGIIEVNKSTADTFSSFATNFLPIHKEHATNIKTHTKVLKNVAKVNQGVAKSFAKFNTLLSQKQLGDYYK